MAGPTRMGLLKRVLAGVPLVLIGALGPWGAQAVAAPAPPHVVIFGDSITWMSAWALRREMPLRHPSVYGVPGVEMAHWFATIARVSGHGEQSDRVIELGTNDVRVGNPNWQADFKTEIGLVASQQCVVFLTVNPVLEIARPGGPTSAEFNAALAQAVATHANFHLLDWGDLEYGNPLWLMADHIHPTSAGSVEMALLEHDALRADCPR